MVETQIHPGLATDGRCAQVPWMDILKNVKGFIDPEYLPDYETLDADPSHLSLAKVKKLLRYWFNQQKSEEIAFQFHYVLEGSERVLGSDPKRITGKTLSKKVPKGRGQPQKTRVTSDITGDEAELLMGVGTVGKKKTSGKHLKKGKAHSKEIISDSGEEFDFAGVDDVSFSDDPPNPIPEVSGSTSTLPCPGYSIWNAWNGGWIPWNGDGLHGMGGWIPWNGGWIPYFFHGMVDGFYGLSR